MIPPLITMAVDHRKPKPAEQSPLIPILSLSLLVFVTFLPCLLNGFVNLDDKSYVARNPHVLQGLTWQDLKWAWSNMESSNWHPLTWISHMLDAQIYGAGPTGHHATNVLLHVLNTVLLFLLLKQMTGAHWRSFIMAAFFGVHPLRVESVAWISERKDVLSVCFWLLATLAYVRYAHEFKARSSKSKMFYGLSVVLFIFGLLAKPMLVTLPFTLLLLDYWPLRRWPQTSIKRLLLEKIPFLILAVGSSVVTFMAQERGGSVTPADALGISARLANAIVSYVRYLGMTAWPTDLSAIYPHPGHWPWQTVAEAGLVLVVITALTLWKLRPMPYLAVGWFWFLGTLVPVIGLVQVGRQAIADRYTYIPSIGLLLAIVWAANGLTEKWRNRKTLASIAISAVLVICVALTVRQISYWKDSKTLFSHAMAVTQRNWIASAYLAAELQDRGELHEAIAMCKESLQMNPYRSDVQCKLAEMFLQLRQFDDARAQFQKAVELDPDDIESRQGLGATLQDMGHLDEAMAQFNQVLRIDPDYADAYSNLGNCYGIQGHFDDAIRCFEQAVKLKPKSAANHHELGVGFAHAKRWDEAVAQFQLATQLDPSDARLQHDLNSAIQSKANAVQTSVPH
jgi:protein O-mannosyl-transferase